jgi:hypothetical protein
MPFHNQMGRFGDLAQAITLMTNPDQRAANVIAANGHIHHQALQSKGFLEPIDPVWTSWNGIFGQLRNSHIGNGGSPLQQSCPKSPPGFPPGYCLHELAPPLKHGSLRWFAQRFGAIKDNLHTKADGSVGVIPSARPVWNFVITVEGEIVTGSEDFEAIKHTCLTGGLDAWSAGQLGIRNGMLELVDLQSGHYVRPNVVVGTNLATQMIAFTGQTFGRYCAHFGLGCLAANFHCVWS